MAEFVKSDLGSYASKTHNIKLTIKYLDPKKAIRACAPNAEDASVGHQLAWAAAHSGMAGFRDLAVGVVRS